MVMIYKLNDVSLIDDETDESTPTCDDDTNCYNIVGTLNCECKAVYDDLATCGIHRNTAMISMTLSLIS